MTACKGEETRGLAMGQKRAEVKAFNRLSVS